MKTVIIHAIQYFTNFLFILILARVLISWFRLPNNNKLVRLLYSLTEPILGPIRSMIQKSPLGGPGMVLDFSPIIAYFLIMLLQNIVCELIRSIP